MPSRLSSGGAGQGRAQEEPGAGQAGKISLPGQAEVSEIAHWEPPAEGPILGRGRVQAKRPEREA